MTRVFMIMGPTASGKSALAMALAHQLGGEVINADSMQVYRDLRVLTARPTVEEEALIPHHLFGHVDAGEVYSVGRWQAEALGVVRSALERGRMPILTGGTGLYFKAVTEGLAEIPGIDPRVREALRARAAAEGAAALHAELAGVDAATAARLSPNDAPRILRALEVWEATGEPISAWQANTKPPLRPGDWIGLVLTPDRETLYAAIERRFDTMVAAGALDEVRALAARGLDPTLPAMKAHGAPALMAHLRGEISLADAIALGKRDTRRYAKRQFTWIANQMPDWPRVAASALKARLDAASALLG